MRLGVVCVGSLVLVLFGVFVKLAFSGSTVLLWVGAGKGGPDVNFLLFQSSPKNIAMPRIKQIPKMISIHFLPVFFSTVCCNSSGSFRFSREA